MRNRHLLSFALILLSVSAVAQKIEKIGAVDDPSIPAAVKSALNDSGSRVLLNDGTPLAEVWLRKSLPKGSSTNPDVLYPQIGLAHMVGVIHFPNAAKDYRGHPVKPGFYTMRYEVQPNDGDHLGTAPNPDFLLLLMPSEDPDPNAAMDFKQLTTLSAHVSGTRHPSVFEMMGPDKGELPRAYLNPDGYVIFSDNMTSEGGTKFPIAVVLKGQAAQ
ncbi:MAG: hypothetical protein ACRD3E_05070 [Terriglobales bacterium]